MTRTEIKVALALWILLALTHMVYFGLNLVNGEWADACVYMAFCLGDAGWALYNESRLRVGGNREQY